MSEAGRNLPRNVHQDAGQWGVSDRQASMELRSKKKEKRA